MEFDKSKVYTALNADELKIGSEVIVADSLERLKSFVENNCRTSRLVSIRDESKVYRFRTLVTSIYIPEYDSDDGDDGDSGNFQDCALAYLVSEPKEKKLKQENAELIGMEKSAETTLRKVIKYLSTCSLDACCNGYFSWLLKNEEKLQDFAKELENV